MTARELARRGAHVFATARSEERGLPEIEKMRNELVADSKDVVGSGKIELAVLDLSSLASVQSFANEFKKTGNNYTLHITATAIY